MSRSPENMAEASSDNQTQLSFLPQDILFQILVRLGARSRGKLSCVSKCFRSILTDPSFLEFQRNWSAPPTRGTTILFSIWHMFKRGDYHPIGCPMTDPTSTPEQFYTINYEENQAGKLLQAKRVRHLDRGWFGDRRAVSFAKDRVCFFTQHSELMVFDLASGQHTSLPKTPSSRFTCALLGYDGVSGTYKVLKAENKYSWGAVTVPMKYWVFTLGVDEEWREIKTPELFYLGGRFINSVCIDSVIYSDNVLYDGTWTTLGRCTELVAFDVRSESFHLIPLPPATRGEDVRKSSLLELHGQFAVIHVNQNKQIIVWTLKTGVKSPSRWKKLVVPFPSDEEILEAGSEFFSKNTCITATSAGDIVLLMLNGIPSLWVLSNKFGVGSVWKKFRIKGIAECSTCVKISSEVLVAQNIAENLFHLE
ncbi:unnamed protein product [Cuscuta epithymum]|uniref:F-box domain-containing protein n=1 Tax=Cuscuta epithymum TaxID=186058 RepID=A0AAV0DJC9_9ASTE|nr:unnamed protein product [Cuscuta epithymum]